jgi:hypothetical protein
MMSPLVSNIGAEDIGAGFSMSEWITDNNRGTRGGEYRIVLAIE